jgi:hypothetical protein
MIGAALELLRPGEYNFKRAVDTPGDKELYTDKSPAAIAYFSSQPPPECLIQQAICLQCCPSPARQCFSSDPMVGWSGCVLSVVGKLSEEQDTEARCCAARRRRRQSTTSVMFP